MSGMLINLKHSYQVAFWLFDAGLLRRLFLRQKFWYGLIVPQQGKVFTRAFFDWCISLGVEVQNVKGLQGLKEVK